MPSRTAYCHIASCDLTALMSRKLCNVRTVSINACSDRTVSSNLPRSDANATVSCTELSRGQQVGVGRGRTHACTSKHQLWDNKLWLWNQIENVVKYERRETCARQIKRHRLHPPSVRSFGLAAPTRCPVNRLGPAARLDATTCYPGVSAYASLGLISSDKSNVSGEFAPLGLTCWDDSDLRGRFRGLEVTWRMRLMPTPSGSSRLNKTPLIDQPVRSAASQ